MDAESGLVEGFVAFSVGLPAGSKQLTSGHEQSGPRVVTDRLVFSWKEDLARNNGVFHDHIADLARQRKISNSQFYGFALLSSRSTLVQLLWGGKSLSPVMYWFPSSYIRVDMGSMRHLAISRVGPMALSDTFSSLGRCRSKDISRDFLSDCWYSSVSLIFASLRWSNCDSAVASIGMCSAFGEPIFREGFPLEENGSLCSWAAGLSRSDVSSTKFVLFVID